MHPLDGARLKVIRAQEHLDSLNSEIGMYLNAHPYEVITNKQSTQDGSSGSINLTIPPPLRLSTLVGDCVVNARAALDYIVWQLAKRYFVNPVLDVDSDKRWVSFPIYRDILTEAYINKINRFTNRQVPTTAITQIQLVQPYNTGYEPLWWLHELVNEDKHRMPLLTVGYIDGVTVNFRNRFGDVIIGEEKRGFVGSRNVSSFTMSGNKSTNPLYFRSSEMKMDAQATIYVAFQDIAMPREPVDRTLEQIVECVATIVPRFESFF